MKFTLVILAGSFAHATSCFDLEGEPSTTLRSDTELTVYRFFSHVDTSRASVSSYRLKKGLFEPFISGFVDVPGGESTELLSDLQKFSYKVVKELGYIQAQQEKSQRAKIGEIHPEQVTFIELTRPASIHEDFLTGKKISAEDYRERFFERTGEHLGWDRRLAAMWIIAGQYMWPHDREILATSSFFRQADFPWKSKLPAVQGYDHSPRTIVIGTRYMPWQQDPDLISRGTLPLSADGHYAELDRKKYPIVFEIGRAVQTQPEQVDAMMRFATAFMVEDVTLPLQSDLDNAFVFVKSFLASRTRLFQRRGFVPVQGAFLGPDNCVLVQPLSELVKRYTPAGNSHRVTRIMKLFNLDRSEALQMLTRIQVNFRAELDFYVPELKLHQRDPIVLHDLSLNYDFLMEWFARYGRVPFEQGLAALKEVKHWRHDFARKDPSLKDVPSIEHFAKQAQTLPLRNFIRLTNLDASQKDNPNYVPAILIGADEYIKQRMQDFIPQEHWEAVVNENDAKYVIQTGNREFAEHIAKTLQPAAWAVLPDATNTKMIYTLVFTRAQVLQLKAIAGPARMHHLRHALQQGFWFFRSLSANPLKI